MIFNDELLTGYRFRVVIIDDYDNKKEKGNKLKNLANGALNHTPIASFSSISKITAKRVTEKVSILGVNDKQSMLSKGMEFDDVTFKKGVFVNLTKNLGGELLGSMVNLNSSNFYVDKYNLLVIAVNQNDIPMFALVLVNCFPKAVEFGEFNAEKGELLMESVTYSAEYIKNFSLSSGKDLLFNNL